MQYFFLCKRDCIVFLVSNILCILHWVISGPEVKLFSTKHAIVNSLTRFTKALPFRFFFQKLPPPPQRLETGGVMCRQWEWRRDLFQWGVDNLVQLKKKLGVGGVWMVDSSGAYTVNSAYKHLMETYYTDIEGGWKLLWNNLLPSKIKSFTWCVVRNRVLTKDNLARRGVLKSIDSVCIGCKEVEESVNHLFFECTYSSKWSACFHWLGLHFVTHN